MMKSLLRILQVCTLIGASSLAIAQEVALKDGHPDVYYVKDGDNLWNIASQFLDSPWQWPELWHVNEEIDNPHLIFPGDSIRLVYVDGRPRLELQREGAQEVVKISPDGSTVKLTPKLRELPLSAAIPVIPLANVESFLVKTQVLSADEVNSSPYMVGGEGGRVTFGRNDLVYARDPYTQWEELAPNYGIYRTGHEYVDPDTDLILGYEALRTGSGSVETHQGDTIGLRVLSSSQELMAGDRVLPAREQALLSSFRPTAPEVEVEAKIIRFFDRLASVARNDVVVLNKGSEHGLELGHVLDVMQQGDIVKDQFMNELVQLPEVNAGTLMVFNVFDKVSYALVMESSRPLNMFDRATNPQPQSLKLK